jgi:hypothetical protein
MSLAGSAFHMDDHCFTCCSAFKAAPPSKHLDLWLIVGQEFCPQLHESRGARNRRKIAHQQRANPLSLIYIDNMEGDFGPSGLENDVTATSDYGLPIFLGDRHGRYMVDDVDDGEIVLLVRAEAALELEEEMV